MHDASSTPWEIPDAGDPARDVGAGRAAISSSRDAERASTPTALQASCLDSDRRPILIPRGDLVYLGGVQFGPQADASPCHATFPRCAISAGLHATAAGLLALRPSVTSSYSWVQHSVTAVSSHCGLRILACAPPANGHPPSSLPARAWRSYNTLALSDCRARPVRASLASPRFRR